MNWEAILFIPVAGLAFGYAGYRLFILVRLMKASRGQARFRLDRIPARVGKIFTHVIGQKAVLQKKWIGTLHTMIFWGFIVITTGTIEQFITTVFPSAHFSAIGEGPYSVLVFVQDLFTFLVTVGVVGAGIRRFIGRPKHLSQSKDANLILAFTFSLMVAIFLMNAFFIVGNHEVYSEYQDFMPFSKIVAGLFSGLPTDSAYHYGIFFKWVHMLIVMGFAVYIPSSKHLHVIAAAPNTFLMNLDREKPMTSIDFANDKITQYGVAKVTDLSWKDTLDYFSCTECGRCQELCPAWNTEKPLSPKKLIIDLKHQLYANKERALAGKYDEITHVIDDQVTEDVIWACTSCRACEIACPVMIEHTDKIFDIRRNLVMMESRFPAEVQPVFKNMETNATPWAFAASDRANWAQGLDVPTMAANAPSDLDVLLWVGCAGSFDDRNKKVLSSFVNILKKASIKFAILGTEEQCTGDPARRIGNEYLFQTLAAANVETLNRYQVKRIVTACPHCFNTLKNEYPALGGAYEVFHHSAYIARLIAEGKIKPTQALNATVTYHDSCYLGRWNNVYEQPRHAIAAIPNVKLVEMKNHHEKGMCCGAGGGRMWMEETIGRRVNVVRTEQAIETGAQIIASACPFCMTMMTDGVKTKEKTDSVKVMDIAELVSNSLT